MTGIDEPADGHLEGLFREFQSARQRFADRCEAVSNAERETEDPASYAELDRAANEAALALSTVQHTIARTPANSLQGLRLKARVFAARWSDLAQMRRWSAERHTPTSQDPQEMLAISMVLDLLEGSLMPHSTPG